MGGFAGLVCCLRLTTSSKLHSRSTELLCCKECVCGLGMCVRFAFIDFGVVFGGGVGRVGWVGWC